MNKRLKEPTSSEKAKRAKALIELSNIKYRRFLEKHIDKTFPALFLERRIGNYQEALLDNQIPALIKSTKDLSGNILPVKLTLVKDTILMGKIV